ncbi:uncharacterized protein LOC110384014 [Helicoverpa armigera]|uniref:uncharacterized protein LOC110384014 n=1 Tax=Helicoverpa armigera TaxID=29058 RepID=UPI000B393644|nr:uncharacterized protein LOC124631937 [Helicoverpa zea]PZC85465.1 hypothetical protein B5X24_HaOG216573 [Helicoverpa armigera]
MSARNYLSAREKNISKLIDCLPNINQQKFGFRSGQELPPLSANTSNLVNRNLNYSFEVQPYMVNSLERAGTPFSDFFSESETGTPDFHSEESDSSSGSALRRSTAEATKTLAAEWERIERTLYNEDGEKCTRPAILDECKQWRQLHPQLRIVGKAIPLPEKRLSYRQIEHDEVIAMHYSDYEQFSESEERLSQSSTDVTPQNSPRVSLAGDLPDHRLARDKVSFYPMYNDDSDLPDSFCSLLQITPIHIHSPYRKRQNPSILRSELASSRWMRNPRPDSSINCDRNSAKSFVSLDTRNYGNMALSASERNTLMSNRVVTARHRDLARLEPICTPEIPQSDVTRLPNGTSSQYNIRKVSLPPLLLEEEKRKVTVGSAKKYNVKTRKSVPRSIYQLDRVRHN